MQTQNILNLSSKKDHQSDAVTVELRQLLTQQLHEVEVQIEEHAGITKAQGKELIEIRKDQEHLYQTMQSLRSEVALLCAKIDMLVFPASKN